MMQHVRPILTRATRVRTVSSSTSLPARPPGPSLWSTPTSPTRSATSRIRPHSPAIGTERPQGRAAQPSTSRSSLASFTTWLQPVRAAAAVTSASRPSPRSGRRSRHRGRAALRCPGPPGRPARWGRTTSSTDQTVAYAPVSAAVRSKVSPCPAASWARRTTGPGPTAAVSWDTAPPTPTQAIAHLRSRQILLTYDAAARTLTAATPRTEPLADLSSAAVMIAENCAATRRQAPTPAPRVGATGALRAVRSRSAAGTRC